MSALIVGDPPQGRAGVYVRRPEKGIIDQTSAAVFVTAAFLVRTSRIIPAIALHGSLLRSA
jgi:hypothetical protein